MRKFIISLVGVFLVSACGPVVDDGRLRVTTTVGMLGDMVENIGGEFVNVQSLMGPGVDPHLYKASAGDIRKIEDADLVFYVGLHLESKMVEVFESVAERKSVTGSAEFLPKSSLIAVADDLYDPHVWFDVDLWAQTIDPIVEALSAADPEHTVEFAANGNRYLAKLNELDQWVEERTLEVAEGNRVLVTAHDAFSYFGQAYGFEVIGIQGISTASDYGLKDLQQTVDLIVDRGIKSIFVESSVSKKSIEALKEGVDSKGGSVTIGGELFSDAMGQAGTEEGTYIGMVKHNINTIVNALK